MLEIQVSMKFKEKLVFKREKYYMSIKKQRRLSYIQLREYLIDNQRVKMSNNLWR
jgi:hypothetical protein